MPRLWGDPRRPARVPRHRGTADLKAHSPAAVTNTARHRPAGQRRGPGSPERTKAPRPSRDRGKPIPSTNDTERLDSHVQKTRTGLTPVTESSSKGVTALNVRCKTLKLPEDGRGENLATSGGSGTGCPQDEGRRAGACCVPGDTVRRREVTAPSVGRDMACAEPARGGGERSSGPRGGRTGPGAGGGRQGWSKKQVKGMGFKTNSKWRVDR